MTAGRTDDDIALKPAENRVKHKIRIAPTGDILDMSVKNSYGPALEGHRAGQWRIPPQHHGHAGPQTDHRADRKIEFTGNDEQSRAQRNDANCAITRRLLRIPSALKPSPANGFGKLAGRDGEISKHPEKKASRQSARFRDGRIQPSASPSRRAYRIPPCACSLVHLNIQKSGQRVATLRCLP